MPYKDKEKQKEYFKRYREEHRKELLQKKRDYCKSEKGIAARKRWNEQNREKVLASKRKEYQRNLEHYREYERKRSKTEHRRNYEKELYEKHKSEKNALQRARWKNDGSYREKRLAAVKAYRERNRDKIAARDKRYAERNADKISAYHKEYQKENAEAIKPRKRKYNESRKIFYGKDPFHAIHRYFQNGYFRYVSTFKTYLYILKLGTKEETPFADFGSRTREVFFQTEPLQLSKDTYQVDFDVTTRQLSGSVVETATMRAVISVKVLQPSEDDIRDIGSDPQSGEKLTR